jgi:signal transduction histidine kinase/ActR/RegA family two-component response regulator
MNKAFCNKRFIKLLLTNALAIAFVFQSFGQYNQQSFKHVGISQGSSNNVVRCITQDNYWNENGVSLEIVMLSTIWKTWWFRSITILCLIALAVFFYIYRVDVLQKRNKTLEDKVNERTKQLTKVNVELNEMNNWILAQNEEISAQNQEIYNKNEEISVQKSLLEEQKNSIEQAYDELTLYRTKLEELVEERTHELLMAKDKAEESDKLKSSFLANLSHEIRTPLNSIIGFSGLIFETDISDTERFKFKSIIESSSNTLLSLINDIIDFSKIEAGRLEIVMKEFNLGNFLDSLKSIFNLEIKKLQIGYNKNIEFKLVVDENTNSIQLTTDEVRLRQILTNLINNAIKFTNEGCIEVGYTINDHKNIIEFYVKDSGIGIREEHQKFIFERFRKVEDDKSNLYRGAGLGLAISHHLVKLLGGDIYVKSVISKGATFLFTIPYQNSKIEKAKQTTFLESVVPQLENVSVLVAEDDYANFEYLDRLLLKTKAKVYHAVNGIQAIDLMTSHPEIQLILMDIKMPEMDGIEALNEIRRRNIQVPVIAQTAYFFSEELRKLIDKGFNDYLEKPVKPKDFYAIISKVFVKK